MKRRELLIFLLWSTAMWAQGHYYNNNGAVTDYMGRPVPYAQVRVCTEPATGSPCTPIATGLYSDAALTHPLPNPFTTDAYGNIDFYSANVGSAYHLQISGSGIQSYEIPYVFLGSAYDTAKFSSPPPLGNVAPNLVYSTGGALNGTIGLTTPLAGVFTTVTSTTVTTTSVLSNLVNSVVNPAMASYGYSGSDIGAPINTVLASSDCPAQGCRIEIPSKATPYSMTTPVANTKSGVTFACAEQGTVINWIPQTGAAFKTDGTQRVKFEGCTLNTTTSNSSATCLQIGGSGYTANTEVDGWSCGVEDSNPHFGIGIHVTGTGTQPAGNTRITNSHNRNFLTAGLQVDHAIDTYVENVDNYALAGNATGAWGTIMETGMSGLYVSHLINGNTGTIWRNTLYGGDYGASTDPYNKAPNFALAVKDLINDTCTNIPTCQKFDSTLATGTGPDSAFRGIKIWEFGGWDGGTPEGSGNPGMLVNAGIDLKFIGRGFRANAGHGVLLDYPNDLNHGNVEFTNVSANDNNIDVNNYDDIHVAAGTSNWSVQGGSLWGTSLGDCCSGARYAIAIEAGPSDDFSVENINAQHHLVGSVLDDSTGIHKSICGVIDNVNTYKVCTVPITAPRFNIDTYFYAYVSGGNPIINWNPGTYMYYNRSGLSLNFVDNSITQFTIDQATGSMYLRGYSNPTSGLKVGSTVVVNSSALVDAGRLAATTGRVPAAVLGSGSPSSTTALFGDQTYKKTPVTLNATSGILASVKAVAGCTTAASIGGVCASPITVTWPAAFADTNYSAGCDASGAPTNLPGSPYIVSKAAGSMTVNYFAITAAAASWATVDCWAEHD